MTNDTSTRPTTSGLRLLVGRDAALERVGELLSARTSEWRLRRGYPKLGVSSRKDLGAVLSAG